MVHEGQGWVLKGRVVGSSRAEMRTLVSRAFMEACSHLCSCSLAFDSRDPEAASPGISQACCPGNEASVWCLKGSGPVPVPRPAQRARSVLPELAASQHRPKGRRGCGDRKPQTVLSAHVMKASLEQGTAVAHCCWALS